MGNAEQKQKTELSQMELVTRVPESSLGQLAIYKHPQTGESAYAKELSSDSVLDWGRTQSYLAENRHLNRLFLTEGVLSIPSESSGGCGGCGGKENCLVFFRLPGKDLEGEIAARSVGIHKSYFTEAEVWYFIDLLLQLEEKMQVENRLHGDLRTSTIFISDEGRLKFVDSNLVDPQMNGLWKTAFGVYRCPLAPEELNKLRQGRGRPESLEERRETSEVWTIGIILLSVCDLKVEDSFYNWDQSSLKMVDIETSLEILEKRYSPLLVGTIRDCLRLEETQRLTLAKLGQRLQLRKQSFNS